MRSRLIVALVAVIALTAFAPVPFTKPNKKEKNAPGNLQGTWELVSLERARGKGKGIGKASSQTKVRIEGDKWSFFRVRDKEMVKGPTYLIVLDKQNPKWIDLKRSADAASTIFGIYRVQGDELKILYTTPIGDAARPTSFANLEGRQILMTLKREKP
jgi:uncharacterized protein (TIGR03067 family)